MTLVARLVGYVEKAGRVGREKGHEESDLPLFPPSPSYTLLHTSSYCINASISGT